MTCDNQQQVTPIPSLPLCSVKPSEDYSLAPSVFTDCYAVWCLTCVGCWRTGSVETTLPCETSAPTSSGFSGQATFPSSLPSSTTTSTALLCRTVCEGPFSFLAGRPIRESRLPVKRTVYGTYGTLRTCPHQNGQTSVAACRTADGGARYIVRATVVHWHRSTALECGLWCAWFAFLHITSYHIISHHIAS